VIRQAKEGSDLEDLELSAEEIRDTLAQSDSPALAVEQEVTQS